MISFRVPSFIVRSGFSKKEIVDKAVAQNPGR